MDWGLKVKQLREKLLLSQMEMAEYVGCAFSSINRYENHLCEPTIKIKRRLRELLIENNMWEE
jgi:DNA-binding XRE family transcriptional regulator